MADWAEIKRLAADFQRAQLSSTVLKLSERNCIEIVQKLVESQLIEVIYTIDGKEYLTPNELLKEIREELEVKGGRVNLVDVQQVLNVDYNHVEAKASELVGIEKNITLVLGQLINNEYLDSIAEEINDNLQDKGQVTMVELTKLYDLPPEFLTEVVQRRMGSIIHGKFDENNRNELYTHTYVNRNKALIAGTFSAVTRPVTVWEYLQRFHLQERLFFSILEDLINKGRINGTITGGRHEKAVYVPDIFTKSQNEYVDNFLQQNGYLEYDALKRIGITDQKGYIKKRYKNRALVSLDSCCLDSLIIEQIETEIEEVLSSSGWVDIMPLMPSICNQNDANILINHLLKARIDVIIFCDSIITRQEFVNGCAQAFDTIIAKKAEEDVKNNPSLLNTAKAATNESSSNRKDENKDKRRQKASVGAKGGGTQGRESKTKSTKKKYNVGKNKGGEDNSDDEGASAGGGKAAFDVKFLSCKEIQNELKKFKPAEECPEELQEEIAARLHRPLTKKYHEKLKSVFLQASGTATGHDRKKVFTDLQDKVNNLYVNTKLFEKAIKMFPDEVQGQLVKHLLRTVCSDITNFVFSAVANDQMLSLNENTDMTPEIRLKLLSKMQDDKTKEMLTSLHASLSAKVLDDFYSCLETLCSSGQLDILLRKIDKKKDRQIVFSHRQAIAEQLRAEDEPAMVLHLAAVLLFQVHTQTMVHAPGRCVPALISQLMQYVGDENIKLLTQYQDLVVKVMKDKTEGATEHQIHETRQQLVSLMPQLKEMALSARRSNNGQNED